MPELAIRKAVRSAFPELDELEPPVDVKSLASKRGVQRIRTVVMQADGIISLVKGSVGEYLIDLNKSHPESRRRFTCAHEIGHTFFFDLDDEIDTRARLQIEDGNLTNVNSNRHEEYLCNVAAAEILMPRRAFTARLDSAGPSAKNIITLSRQFKTSLWATARRMVEIYRYINLVVALWEHQPDLDYYQTSWVIRSLNARPREKLIADKSAPIFRTFQSASSFRGRKLVSLGGNLEDYFVDGCALRASARRAVLTVFILDERAVNRFGAAGESHPGFEQMQLFK